MNPTAAYGVSASRNNDTNVVNPPLYVFNVGKDESFIIMSGEDSTPVETVAAGEGVLLRSLNGGSAEETLPTTKTTKNADNAFVGVSEAVILNETSGDYTNFVLSKKDNVVGFFKANNTRVATGKAYLPVKDFAAASREFSIVFDGEVTGISEFTPNQTTDDDAIYTLGGVRVVNPVKGIYIKNGKKVVVK